MIQEKNKYFQAVGKHKTSVPMVKLNPGEGKLIVNEQEIKDQNLGFLKPLKLVGDVNKFDLKVKVFGGGVIGQFKAIQLGIARAIVKYDASMSTTLKKLGLLTRDSRQKERKKYGLKSARRSPQWSKR